MLARLFGARAPSAETNTPHKDEEHTDEEEECCEEGCEETGQRIVRAAFFAWVSLTEPAIAMV